MPARFQILQSEATRNLVQNPSAETNITGWFAHGAAIARSTAEARFGRHSVSVVTNGAAVNEGASVRSYPNTNGTNYAGSIYVRGGGRLRLRFRDNFNGDEFISPEFSPSANRWIRIQDIIGRTGLVASNDLRIYVETVGVQVATFYVDGAQIEEGAYSTTYCDGEQDGCRWNIQKHGSVSDRLDNERSGGRFIDLVEEDSDLYITMAGGIGMPPLRHNLQGRALLPGLEFQSTKILPRTITLTIWTKNKDASPENLNLIHQARQRLIDIIKPDRVTPDQKFILRYNNGPVPLDIKCLYEAGLEFEGDIRNPYFNSFAIRFLITDPFWTEDNQHVATLDPIDMLAIQNGLIAKINRQWDDLGLVNNRVMSLAIGPDGILYAAGDFNMIGGIGANGIAGYDGTNWFALGAGLNVGVGPGINIAFGPDGSLYVCGSFTIAGGVALTAYIARWDFNTNLWNSVGGGLDAPAYSMSFAPDGSFYITGPFNFADPTGGNILVNGAARFVNGAWQALIDTGVGGGNGLNDPGGAGLEVAAASSGQVYFGGVFADAGAVPNTVNIAKWDPTNLTWNSIGNVAPGANGVGALAIAPNGLVYAGGDYTSIGGVTLNGAGVWNGTAWSPTAGGVNGNVRWIFFASDGLVWYVGDFIQALDVSGVAVPNTDHVAIWDGSQWVPPQFTVPTNLTRMRTINISGEDMYFGGEGPLGNAFISSPNLVNSLATADSFPIFHFERVGGTNVILIMILNETSRRQMKFTYEMSDGEEVEIDLRLGRKTIKSSLFNVNIDVADALRNQLGELLPGSDFANWALVPGLNNISIYTQPIGDPTIEASMRWVPLHWSADAVGA